jgi:hypothetical protein
MKTKEGDGKKKNSVPILIIGFLSIVLILAILAFSMQITSLQHHLTQANLTIAQAHSQILNLNHSLAQQKAQITNLTNIINLNETQVIFNKPISIGPGELMSSCGAFGCLHYRAAASMTLHFNFTHAGYIVINTTGQSNIFLALRQNYSKTWLGVNDTDVIGDLNFSIRSLTMPVLPGPATLMLITSAYLYNATNVTPYEAQLKITYHS